MLSIMRIMGTLVTGTMTHGTCTCTCTTGIHGTGNDCAYDGLLCIGIHHEEWGDGSSDGSSDGLG